MKSRCCEIKMFEVQNPTAACNSPYIGLEAMPTSLSTEVSNLRKKIALKEAKHNRLMAIVIRPLKHEIKALKATLRAKEKQVARAKVGSDPRGRKQRFPGRCMACCKRWLGEPGGCAHDLKLCAKTQVFFKKGRPI